MSTGAGDNLARRIEHRRLDEVHECVVCGARANEAFAASEDGRLAGRIWSTGDMIDLCHPHARDVRHAATAPRDQVADWLKPDLKPDISDVFGILDGFGS